MRWVLPAGVRGVMGILTVLGLLGLGSCADAPPAPASHSMRRGAACGDTSAYAKVNLSALPPEATQTVNLIKRGGPFPYRQDGEVWADREGSLPRCASGYYHEYTVKTPGGRDRGARRFVVGRGGEYFYTDDHYETFRLTNINA